MFMHANLETTDHRPPDLEQEASRWPVSPTSAMSASRRRLRPRSSMRRGSVESRVGACSPRTARGGPLINMKNPRTPVSSNDAVAVGYVRGGEQRGRGGSEKTARQRRRLLQSRTEVRAIDLIQGATHNLAWLVISPGARLGVPRSLSRVSTPTVPEDDRTRTLRVSRADHWTLAFQRAVGGYTRDGDLGSIRHVGNKPISNPPAQPESGQTEARQLESLDGQRSDSAGYLSTIQRRRSALMVSSIRFMTDEPDDAHGMGVGHWRPQRVEATTSPRSPPGSDRPRRLSALRVRKRQLPNKIRGPGFSEKFIAMGPMDGRGRSLRGKLISSVVWRSYPCER